MIHYAVDIAMLICSVPDMAITNQSVYVHACTHTKLYCMWEKFGGVNIGKWANQRAKYQRVAAMVDNKTQLTIINFE